MKTYVNVGVQRYEVPQKITAAQFSSVSDFGLEDKRTRHYAAAVLLNAELLAFKDIEEEDLDLIFSVALTSMSSLDTPQQYGGPTDFNMLTFGQFIDLDSLSHEGINKNLIEIIHLIYGEDPEIIADQPLDKYWSGILEWIDCRTSIYRRYETFFGTNDSIESDGEREPTDAKRVWFMAAVTLAGDDFMKLHQVVDRPLIEALNFLSYLKEQNIKKAEQQRHAMRMSKR